MQWYDKSPKKRSIPPKPILSAQENTVFHYFKSPAGLSEPVADRADNYFQMASVRVEL